MVPADDNYTNKFDPADIPEFTDEISDDIGDGLEGGAATAEMPVVQTETEPEPASEEASVSEKAPQAEEIDPDTTFDVEINDMEWEVETESDTSTADEPEDTSYEETETVYDRGYDGGGYSGRGYYDRGYGSGYNQRRRRSRRAVRRINKHIFTWIFSFVLGMYGVDRFARGQIGLGLLKLCTFGGFGFWYLTDVAIAAVKSYAGSGAYEEDLSFDALGRYVD